MSETADKASKIAAEIALPASNYKLYCWKVRNGSAVRVGETLALAVRKDVISTVISAPSEAAVAAPVALKRATRRRRPGEYPTAATENVVMKDTDPTSEKNCDKAHAKSEQERVAVVAQADGIVHMGPGDSKSDEVIGRIEHCRHPAVIDRLCAVCGQSTLPTGNPANPSTNGNTDSTSIDTSHPSSDKSKMSRVTVSGLTLTVSDAEGRRMAQQDADRLIKQKKLSLVLDLDHTLVHATNDLRARQYLGRQDVRSLVLPLMEDPSPEQQHMFMQHFVKLRPFVTEFLEKTMPLYEIGVYTMGTRHYAEQICMLLARHLVGATCDQVDLEHLRQRVAHLESEVVRDEAKAVTKASKASEKTETSTLSADVKSSSSPMDTTTSMPASGESSSNGAEKVVAIEAMLPNKSGDEEDADHEKHGKKRKRVTFGELPPPMHTKHQKTEHKSSAEQLETLKGHLEEAEQKEREAVSLRQRIFGSRVVSRTDVVDLGRDVKSLKRIFPCGGTMAVVVDDREDVWANAGDINSARRGDPPENLLLVRPYHWGSFTGFADVNNASGADLSGEATVVEELETDDQLLKTLDILKRVHTQYYSPQNTETNRRTVPELLRGIRHQVLAGTKMVLSGLVPLHKQNVADGSSRPRPAVVRYVESMGAILLPTVKDGVTTHVVAAKDGTDKTISGRKVRGCVVVKASWLMECVWSLRRQNEAHHLLGPARPTLPPSTHVQASADPKKENSSTSSEDDEDDDLAAAFESEFMDSES